MVANLKKRLVIYLRLTAYSIIQSTKLKTNIVIQLTNKNKNPKYIFIYDYDRT